MKRNIKRQQDNNFIEQKVAEAFGYSDEQLAEELDRFVEEAEKSDNRGLEAPEGEFQRIWDRVEGGSSGRRWKGSRVRKLVKVMAVAAILGTMMLGGGMWVGAKRHYVYEMRERKDMDNVIVLDNCSDNLIRDDSLEEEKAYNQIKDELNMKVFELSYLPQGMSFNEMKISVDTCRLEFSYDKDWLYFYQGISDKPTSLSYASDMKECKRVYNSFLNREIPIYEGLLEDGGKEFSIRFVEEDRYYFLHGVLDEEEFIKIVCEIKEYIN